ncbi:FAD-dependent oxidoreductase [Novosphingobium cyanobacteriorum]|uniref:FAD-binding protein n=1 Tax=Novosphingobium cyanobacteriorum TaxID=3024215 RepID=A0ABT6CQZ9_9SPHN|nr:FAD-dependent oxidoreductase [Novosphingobium cyanobacteriorum]MDF8334907.1 FAD-binding protein [Novosphingobium cyanobacteriorum]
MRLVECDVAVIGGGLGGLTAALRVAEGGRKVVVFEKSGEDRYVNNTRVCAGVFHLALTDITADEDALVEKITTITGGMAEPEQTRAVSRDARRAVKYLQNHGVRFMRGSPEPHHNYVLTPPALIRVGLQWEGRAGDVLMRTLESELTKAGGNIARGHHVTAITRDAGGAITGLEGTDSDGPFTVHAANVVVADGGFPADPEMLRKYITPAPDKVLQRNTRKGAGDGIRMAQAIGAALSERMDGFYGHVMHRNAMTNDNLWPYPWYDDICTNAIIVGDDGKRFCDEGFGGPHIANRIAALDDPLSTWVIFDQAIWEEGGKARSFPANPHMEANGGPIERADTLEQLAEKISIPAETLMATVNAYNAAVDAGTTEQLDPPRATFRYKPWKITQGPFYAGPACAGITYTMGGLRIDGLCRVLDTGGAVIPGLYAVGTSTGGIEGGDRTGYVGGLAKTAATALRAAEHITGDLAA